MSVISVDGAGIATVLDDERRALDDIRRRAAPPEQCGPEIPVAPARGPMRAFMPREMVMTENGNLVARRSGYAGRSAAQRLDAFDLMECNARKAHDRAARTAEARAQKDGHAFRFPAFIPPFTPGQVSAARDYAALTERCAASGVRSVLNDDVASGGSRAGDREFAIFRDLQRLRVLHRRIGDGLAREVRRHRFGGARRQAIWVRRLVDLVCLSDMTIDQVLRAHGWVSDARIRASVRASLAAALDRMQGYDLVGDQNVC